MGLALSELECWHICLCGTYTSCVLKWHRSCLPCWNERTPQNDGEMWRRHWYFLRRWLTQIWMHPSTHARTHARTRTHITNMLSFTAEAAVRFQEILYWICKGRSGVGMGASATTSVFSCQLYSTNMPTYIRLPLTSARPDIFAK